MQLGDRPDSFQQYSHLIKWFYVDAEDYEARVCALVNDVADVKFAN